MVVPIGTKSPQKAKESLAEMINIYKEDINLDFDSGELSINGAPSMQFYKNYLFPSKNGEQPDISVIGGEGFDLSDTDALKYFKDKVMEDSKIPFSRFDRANGGGQYSSGADNVDRDEIRFFKFITRLRSIYQEIILKPLFIQMGLLYPELAEDELFKSTLSLTFNKDNVFEELKQMQIMTQRVDFATSMMGITDKKKDATGMDVDVPYFNPKFVIEKYLKLSPDDVAANERMQKEKAQQDLADMKLAQQIQNAGGGMGGMGMGGF